MRRRGFIVGLGAVGLPLIGRAQQAERMRHIGALMRYAECDPESQARVATSPSRSNAVQLWSTVYLKAQSPLICRSNNRRASRLCST